MKNNYRPFVDLMCSHEEVSGSCNFGAIKLPNKESIHYFVDCGLFQEALYENLNTSLIFDPRKVDMGFLTHVHVDHSGRLPYLSKMGLDAPIYASKATCKLLPYVLGDSYKVLSCNAKIKHIPKLYSDKDVSTILGRRFPCEYEKSIQVHNNVTATLFNNGHLLGASSVRLQISYPGCENINIFYTGDYHNRNMFFDVKPLPRYVLEEPTVMVIESTYGDTNSYEAEECFCKNIKEHFKKYPHGTILILAFSLGRGQEIPYILKCMQKSGDLDSNIKIYHDGELKNKYIRMFSQEELGILPEMRDFLPNNSIFVDDESTRIRLVKENGSKIIITSSGMGSYGPAQFYIPHYIDKPDALIHFTGYAAEGTIARYLKDAKQCDEVKICGATKVKLANVQYTSEYSAHAKADELIEFLKQFKNLTTVLINHGESETKQAFARRVLREVDVDYVEILGRDTYFRVNHSGVIR